MFRGSVVIIRNAAATDFGGGERFPVFLAKKLSESEFGTVIISRSSKLLDFAKMDNLKTIRGWWWPKQNWSGIGVFLFPVYLFWQVILYFYYLILFIRLRPSVVHIQSKDDFISATFAAKTLHIRAVWTDHADLKHIWRNLTVWYKNPVGKLVYGAAKKTDAITVVSKSELSLVTAHLPANSPILPKITVVYNGVADTSALYVTGKFSGPTFCIASRLVEDKGIREAIEAFEQVALKHPSATLTILGDGPDKNIFKKQANNKPGISFLGHQKDPLSYIARSTIFIHPTYHEGFSVALVEASMLGRAIVATAVGGNTEIIIDSQTGLLVPPKDSSSLAKAMLRLAEDVELASRLGANAYRQYTERFEFSRIVERQFLPLYNGDNI